MSQVPIRADAAANRERLIDAARAVFAERGLTAEMKEIAERAGVGVGTLYRNFATKDDLIRAIMQCAVDDVRPRIEALHTIEDPVAALDELLTIALQKAELEGPIIRALLAGTLEQGGLEEDGPPEAFMQEIASMIRRGIDSGAFRPSLDPYFTAWFIGMQLPAYVQLRQHFTIDETLPRFHDLVRGAILRGEGT